MTRLDTTCASSTSLLSMTTPNKNINNTSIVSNLFNIYVDDNTMGMTLRACRQRLRIDEASYQAIRARFAEICKETGINRDVNIEPKRWQEAKDKLISHIPALQLAFPRTQIPTSQGSRDGEAATEVMEIALDRICRDVADRSKDKSKWTIYQKWETLGINPTQGNEVRQNLYRIMDRMARESPNFDGTKKCAGPVRLKALLKEWVESSPALQTGSTHEHGNEGDKERLEVLEKLAITMMGCWRVNRTYREYRENVAHSRDNGSARSVRSEPPAELSPTPAEDGIGPQTHRRMSEHGPSKVDDRMCDILGVARNKSKTTTPPPHYVQGLSNPDQLPTPTSAPTGSSDVRNEVINAMAIKIPLCEAHPFTMQFRVDEASTATVEALTQVYNVPVCPANVLELLGYVFKTWPDFKGPISSINGMAEGNVLKIFSPHPHEKARDPNEIENGRLIQYLKSVSERGALPVFVVTLERFTVKA